MSIAHFLEAVKAWAENCPDVVGIALVGSHARGVARPDSDIDLVVISNSPADLLEGAWPECFGEVRSSLIEDYGALKSRRIHYSNGLEVEFGIAAPSWAAMPLDAGTRRVLNNGVKVLHDPKQLLGVASDAAA